MAQFEIRRALPQDVQRITEIYNSNTEFLLHHLGRERVDRHFIAREMEEMRRVGFLSCVLVERESGLEGYPGSAAPFWEKQGFVRTGRAKLAWDGCSAEAAVMVKQLACAGGQHAPSSVRR